MKFPSLKKFDKTFWVLVALSLLATFTSIAVTLFLSSYFERVLHLEPDIIGSIFTIAQLIGISGYVFAASLVDFVGRKRILISSIVGQLVAVSLLLSSVVAGPDALVAVGSLVIFFPAQVLSGVSISSMIADVIQADRRMEAYALQRIAVNLGFAAAPSIGGVLSTVSYSTTFAVPEFSVIASLTLAFLLRETHFAGPLLRGFRASGLRSVFKDHLLVKFSIASLFFQLTYSQFIVPVSIYVVSAGISTVELGYLYTLNGLLVIVLQYPLVRIFKKRAETEVLAVGCAFYALGLFSLGLAHSIEYFVISVVIITVGEVITLPSGFSAVTQLSTADERGRYLSLFGLFGRVGWSLGPFVGGSLLALSNGSSIQAWSGIASFGVVASIGYWRIRSEVANRIRSIQTRTTQIVTSPS